MELQLPWNIYVVVSDYFCQSFNTSILAMFVIKSGKVHNLNYIKD